MRFLLIAVIILLLIVGYFLRKKYPNNKTKNVLNIANILLIVLLLELTVFNINSYRLYWGNYEKEEYKINTDNYTEYMNGNKVTNGFTLEQEICNINKEIGTIKLNINSDKLINYTILYTDETGAEYRQLPSKVLVNGIENSKSISCFFSGKTEKIKILLELQEGTTLELNSVQINEPIELNINLIRYLTISILVIFIYALINISIFNIPYDKNKKSHKIILALILVIFIALLYWCSATSVIGDFSYGKAYTHSFVNSIMNGQLSLLEQPSQELKQMENPYDQTLRSKNEVPVIWDAAYYNGQYYIYFGIFPVLTLLLPYKLITGEYMAAHIATFIYSLLAAFFLVKIIIAMYKKWFSKLPFKLLVISVVSMLMGSLLLWLCRRPSMYELVIAAGYYLILQGIFFIFKAIEKENVNYKYLTIACISMALAVACRPTLLLASIIIIPILLKIFIKNIKEKRNILKLVLTVGVPYAIVGIGLMIYNYIRFDNIFEFGTNYQLTLNDMGNLSYRIMTIPLGILNYFFTLPYTSTYFPFVSTTSEIINFNGYYTTSPMAAGLIILNPILLVLLFIPKIKKYIPKDLFKWLISLIIVGGIISIVEIVVGGSYQRYAADYVWMLLLAAILVIFAIYEIIKSETIRKYIFGGLLTIVLFSSIINFLLCGIQGEANTLKNLHNEQYYGIRYSISFWE